MSTWLYLECQDHDPPILAESDSGQHLYDLPQLRADLASRPALDDLGPEERYRRNTALFLQAHPRCQVGIRDEYGHEHPIEEAG